MARVLVTRAAPEAAETAARLRALGHEPVVSPLLRIVPASPPPELPALLAAAQAVLVTSAAGAKAAGALAAPMAARLFAVGAATAAALHAAGWPHAEAAEGTAKDLFELVRAACRPEAGPILYLSGDPIAQPLDAWLEAAGFTVRRVILYRSEAVRTLAPEAEGCAAVLFHSRRAAEAAAALPQTDQARLAGAIALCISPAVAEAAKELPVRAALAAAAPTEAALLAQLAAVLA